MTDTFRVISPGSGVQSFTLAVMSALGDLTRVNAAVRIETLSMKMRDLWLYEVPH
jgi:uncharacterized ion transporter superfamily protein YfcC